MEVSLHLHLDNVIESIDMYKYLIIITNDYKLVSIYIDCLNLMEKSLNKMFKYLVENQEKHPEEYVKILEYHSKRKLKYQEN